MRHIQNREYITEMELRGEPYQFDILGLWRGEDGFYLGTDSGCSCPTPWESTTTEDLTGPLTLDQMAEETVSLWIAAGRRVTESDVHDFLTDALKSFLTTLDTTWTVNNAWDLPDRALTLSDANGVTWTRVSDYGSFTSETGIEKDEYALDYPVTIIEHKKED